MNELAAVAGADHQHLLTAPGLVRIIMSCSIMVLSPLLVMTLRLSCPLVAVLYFAEACIRVMDNTC